MVWMMWLRMHLRQTLARPMCLWPSLQSRTSSECSRSLAWRTKLQASKLSKKKGQQTVSLKAREEGKENLAQVARWSLSKEGSRGRHTEQQHKYHISCKPNNTEWSLRKELGGTFSHREWGGDWRSDTQHGFSREGVLEWSSCRHWYIGPSWQDRDGTTTVRHLLRVNPGARRQRALDSKSQLAIRSMTETRNRQSILVDARQWWM